MFEEKIQPNKVNAPILFIGAGGIGSKIVGGVAKRSQKDDTSNIRFVVMDTDVNDLLKVNKGSKIVAIQTSSTKTVEEYLKNDDDARDGWFPENKMLDSKSVSEGAGQVRAISRLALNAIIKQADIHTLYKTIDELFLKDGGEMKQAIRVVIASTAAGGTGSGIAMELGMLVRHYVKKNYPEAAVMIRGFLVMPGVLDTVIKTQSERDSLRCNGYATIKEINAFMMKGSGFFDTVPELQRYKDLHMVIPNSSSGDESLSNLPFDFCFLMDRTDSNEGNMATLGQYIDYAAQAIYEQNIGPMYTKASSMEDNVLKLCISPERLGRCRFAGVGASVLRYPYEEVRDYIALNWTRSSIIGSSADDNLTEEQRKALLATSWLQYDVKYKEERKKWEDNPNRGPEEPSLAKVYIDAMNGGRDSSGGNDFTASLWAKFITPKLEVLPKGEKSIEGLAKNYIKTLVEHTIRERFKQHFSGMAENIDVSERPATQRGQCQNKYNMINEIYDMSLDALMAEDTAVFAKEVFSSRASVARSGLGDYMLEKFLSINGKAIHPNAARFLLYVLDKIMGEELKTAQQNANREAYMKAVDDIVYGKEVEGKRDTETFDTKGTLLGKERDLIAMCKACDQKGNADDISECDKKLSAMFQEVKKYYTAIIKEQICLIGQPAIKNLIAEYKRFYDTFEEKVPSIERKKEDIITSLEFKNGDCVLNIMGERKVLDKLVDGIGIAADDADAAAELYGKIFEEVRENAYREERRSANPFAFESKKDIFDDVIIEYYKNSVERSCDLIKVKGILQAIKLEYDIKGTIELSGMSEERRAEKAEEIKGTDGCAKYIKDILARCHNLASPGIKKNDAEEDREVTAVACSDNMTDGGGIRVSDYIPEALRTDTISRYELHFFRAVYNIMPTQIAKLCAPRYGEGQDEFTLESGKEYEGLAAGDYFCIYQKYMDKIGPDCKRTAVITPHVDMRWNSIVELPELDLEYQKIIMKKIHKAMLYGFLYDRIHLFASLDESSAEKTYKYFNDEGDPVDLKVSNRTKCDILYEVLDALYSDRLAVYEMRGYVNKLREKNRNKGFQSYDELDFFKSLKSFRFKQFVNNAALNLAEDPVSLFTVVLMYCNSLPAQNKDMAEMKNMVNAIIEMIYSEMDLCASNKESLDAKVAGVLVDQYQLMVENYNAHIGELKTGNFTKEVGDSIRRILRESLIKKDLERYAEKLAAFPEN